VFGVKRIGSQRGQLGGGDPRSRNFFERGQKQKRWDCQDCQVLPTVRASGLNWEKGVLKTPKGDSWTSKSGTERRDLGLVSGLEKTTTEKNVFFGNVVSTGGNGEEESGTKLIERRRRKVI